MRVSLWLPRLPIVTTFTGTEMEDQFFTYTGGFDVVDDTTIQFYDVTTKVDIEDIKVGSEFETAVIDFGKGELTLFKNDQERKFKLKLSVSHEISV